MNTLSQKRADEFRQLAIHILANLGSLEYLNPISPYQYYEDEKVYIRADIKHQEGEFVYVRYSVSIKKPLKQIDKLANRVTKSGETKNFGMEPKQLIDFSGKNTLVLDIPSLKDRTKFYQKGRTEYYRPGKWEEHLENLSQTLDKIANISKELNNVPVDDDDLFGDM
jgi:hypothetical protein